ncbi:PREDICTED: uncharacterized protein LOC109381257 [Hipposideros armiger]|uniref:Uncharacterized protein LOC109381257 n=1 Tax=Hipposideros armiger TaxID=186990 RepID=A0A8B7R2T5_HIPAR|nr:PREDICTED: uncharacterized protein LOC109381257 [Hipposideros armiger]
MTRAVTLRSALCVIVSALVLMLGNTYFRSHTRLSSSVSPVVTWAEIQGRPKESGLKGERPMTTRPHAAPAASPMPVPLGLTGTQMTLDRGHVWKVTDTGWRSTGSRRTGTCLLCLPQCPRAQTSPWHEAGTHQTSLPVLLVKPGRHALGPGTLLEHRQKQNSELQKLGQPPRARRPMIGLQFFITVRESTLRLPSDATSLEEKVATSTSC